VSALAAAAADTEGATEFLPSAAAAGTQAMPPVAGGYPNHPPGGAAAAGLGADGPNRLPGTPDRSNYAFDGRGGRGGKRGGYLLLVLGMIAVFALVAFIAASVFSKDNTTSTASLKVPVPTVKGLTLAEAQASLTKVGLSWKVVRASDEQIEKGRISAVDPPQGTEVPKGTTVTLTQSTGSAKGSIPDVANKPLDEARAQLTQAGFTVGKTEYKDDPDVKQGYVISTNPPINSSHPKGTVVNVVVASGNVHVPNLIGKTVSEAKSTLKGDLGLKVEVDYVTDDAPDDEVVDQNIKDTSVSQGSTVRLTVSSGPAEEPPPPTSDPPTSDPPTSNPTDTPTWIPSFPGP
jgi:serine/threonine-protein kinase